MFILKKQQVKDGNTESIENICNATWESVYRFIYYKVQNREEAEDITQETYVKAIPHLQKGKVNPDKYLGFLRTVALNVMRGLWRKKKRRRPSVNIETFPTLELAVVDPSENSAERITIVNALSQLNKEQRTVIEIRILKGYSVADTAKMLKKTEVAIRVMQHRALQTLAGILKTN